MKKILILIFAVTLLAGCANKITQRACTEEAKLCPDGSAVGRTGPNCEFALCPTTNANSAVCGQEEKLCPNGTYIGRTGPNCEFADCPGKISADINALKNGTYTINGQVITLKNGYNEMAIAGSAAKQITRYFGNEVMADFNGDGILDTAFLLTQESGGSGVFFYVVAKLGNEDKGTNAILLGDRIAPQTTEFKGNTIIVNYADRKSGEPFTAQPSVGVSRYLVIVDQKMVESILTEPQAAAIAEKTCVKGGEALGIGTYNANTKTWWFDANLNATKPGCNPACVVDETTETAEINWRCTGLIPPTQ